MRRLALIASIVAFGGCGTPPGDLFVATGAGSIPGAKAVLDVTDDGHVKCNGAGEVPITSAQLITAREVVRDLAKLARRRVHLQPREGSILRYGIRTADGAVSFADNSTGQPKVFYRAAYLVRQLAVGPCRLPR